MDCGKPGQSVKWDSHCPGHVLAAKNKYPSGRHFQSLQRSPRNHHSHGGPTGHMGAPPRGPPGAMSCSQATPTSLPQLPTNGSLSRLINPTMEPPCHLLIESSRISFSQEGTRHLWRGVSVGGTIAYGRQGITMSHILKLEARGSEPSWNDLTEAVTPLCLGQLIESRDICLMSLFKPWPLIGHVALSY